MAHEPSDDSFNLQTLIELKKAFDEADSTGKGALELEEFLTAFKRVKSLADGLTPEEINHLFMKIDANSDGTVDWEEFTNHLLLEQIAADENEDLKAGFYSKIDNMSSLTSMESFKGRNTSNKRKTQNKSFNKNADLKLKKAGDQVYIPSGIKGRKDYLAKEEHGDMIFKVMVLETPNVYVTGGRDGTVRSWDPRSLRQINVAVNGQSWITDMTVTQALPSHPLAVTSVDRTISFYDSSKYSMSIFGRIIDMEHTPTAAMWLETSHSSTQLLIGDEKGHLHQYDTSKLLWANDTKARNKEKYDVLASQMASQQSQRLHKDWITQLGYLSFIESLVSTSMDGTMRLYDLEKRTVKWEAQTQKGGVYGYDLCRTFNFLATCGLERNIHLWNPFTGRSISTLQGHSTSVVCVKVVDSLNRLFSLSADKVIKVWDIRTNRCFQTITDTANYWPENCLYSLCYDQQQQRIISGSTKPVIFERKSEEVIGIMPIRAALWNSNFMQVVTCDGASIIKVYTAHTGQLVFSFPAGSAREQISAIAFDDTKRRMIAGCRDGTIRVWNFNNGQILAQLVGFGRNEVSCCCYIEDGNTQLITAAGWNRAVCAWYDSGDEHEISLHHCIADNEDDILCLYFARPNIVITGAFNGKVTFGKLDGSVKACLTMPEHDDSDMDKQPINCILEVPEQDDLVVTAREDGAVCFWDIRETKVVHHFQSSAKSSGVRGICFSVDGKTIFTAHACGYVKSWEIQYGPSSSSIDNVSLKNCWVAHPESKAISSIHFAVLDDRNENSNEKNQESNEPDNDDLQNRKRVSESGNKDEAEHHYIITSSEDGTTRLFDETGIFIGIFGQENAWEISNPETFVATEAQYIEDLPDIDQEESPDTTATIANMSSESLESEALRDWLLDAEKEEIFARHKAHRKMTAMTETATRSLRLLEPINIPQGYSACM